MYRTRLAWAGIAALVTALPALPWLVPAAADLVISGGLL